jgi:hypothetical protein
MTDLEKATRDAVSRPSSPNGAQQRTEAPRDRVPRLKLTRVALDRRVSPYFAT